MIQLWLEQLAGAIGQSGWLGPLLALLAGGLMVAMAMQTWELVVFVQPAALLGKSRARGYVGALVAGLLGGIFASPCATPVLMALLTIAAGQDRLLWGMALLLCYGLGNGLLILLLGGSLGAVQQLKQDPRYVRFCRVSQVLLGFVILLLGLWFFYLAF